MSFVTVVVPVYNAEKHLKEAVESVIGQSDPDWEMILVDDGSSDGSSEICDEFAEKDQRIRVFHQANEGSFSAVRKGLLEVQTEYVMFLDADDLYEQDMIRVMKTTIADTGADIVRCGYRKFAPNGSLTVPLPVADETYEKEQIHDVILHSFYESDGNIYRYWSAARWDKIYRTDLLKEIYDVLDPETTIGEDLDMNLNYLEKAEKIMTVDQYLYRYRMQEESLAHGYSVKMEQQYQKLWQAVRSSANRWNHAYNAEKAFIDQGIISMMAETSAMSKEDRRTAMRHLYAMLNHKSKVWKLVLQADFPGKETLQKTVRKLRRK